MAKKWFKWTVQIEVDATWVEDGFDLTDERAKSMLANDLRYADGSELRAKVIKRPADHEIATAQGFKSVEEYRADRDGRKAG